MNGGKGSGGIVDCKLLIMASYKWPEELPCYQLAREFRIRIAAFCKILPRQEKYRLQDQMLRAARSVTANIALRPVGA